MCRATQSIKWNVANRENSFHQPITNQPGKLLSTREDGCELSAVNLSPTGKFLSFDVKVCESFSIPFKLKLVNLCIVAVQCLVNCKSSLIPIRLLNLKKLK